MRIRCERCATLYRLDPSLLPPGGGPVQCTRCGHVFVASPAPHDPASTAVPPMPMVPAGMPPAAAVARRPVAGTVAEAGSRGVAAGAPGRREAASAATAAWPATSAATAAWPAARGATGARPAVPPKEAAAPATSAATAAWPAAPAATAARPNGARPAVPPVEAAAPAGAAPAAEAPAATPDDLVDAFFAAAPGGEAPEPEVVAFEQGLHRKRRIVAGTVIGVLGLAAVAGVATVLVRELGGPSHDPAAVAKVDRLLAAVRTGSPAEALAAAPLADEALAIDPGFLRARADRGLALLLAAMERKDAADRVAARRPPIERELRKAEESGDPEATKAPLAALEALKAEYDPLLAAYGKLKAEADAAIEGAYREAADDPAAVRAMGMLRASGGDEKNAPILAANYRKLAGDADGWAELIEGQLHAAGRASPEKRARAVERLTAALEKAPDLGIASLLLGRVRFELQDLDGARKDLDRALAAAPGNELAKRWRTDLEVPPPPKPGEAAAVPADPATAAASSAPGTTPSPAVPAAG